MYVILFLLSVAWVVVGSFLVLNTEQFRDWASSALAPDRMRLLAVIPLVLGAVLFIGSFSMDRLFWWAFLLGIAAATKGVYLLRSSAERVGSLTEWWLVQADDRVLRLWGIVAIVLGTALLSQLAG